MTLNEFTYAILDKIQPYLSKDSEISLREIEAEIAFQRSLLIRNELNKKRTIDPNIIQDLGCLQLETVDSSLCCDVPSGCNILQTKDNIPRTIELHYMPAITRVGPVDRLDKQYSLITWERAPYIGQGKYTRNLSYAIYDNAKIYIITNNPLLEYINVKGVFEDPKAAGKFKKCGTDLPCFSPDSEYPMNSWMFAYIEDIVINKFIRQIQLPVDTQTDGVDTQNKNIQEQ